MFDLWLSSSTLVIVLVPFVVLYAIAFLIGWVTHKSSARPYFASCIGIPGPFFASVAVLFGLFAAFLANDVQRRGANAEAAVFREAEGIRTLSGDISSPMSWLAVIALGVLTQIAVAVVQLDKARPQALALFVFTTAFALTVALIGAGERPFSGRMIDDEPLREAMTSVNP